MNPRWYDDFEQITLRCASLATFHELLEERRRAGFTRKEKLDEFIVHGIWFLDVFGQCGKFKKPEVYVEAEKRYALVPFDFPAVVRKEDFVKCIPQDATWGHGFGGNNGHPVPHGVVCPSCGTGWSVADSDAFVKERSEAVVKGSDFVGKTLEEVCAILNEEKTAFYVVSPFPVTNPEWVDKSPRYEKEDSIAKNEKGWAQEKRSGSSADYPVVDKDTYQARVDDMLHFDVYRFWHADCHSEKLAVESMIEFGNALMKAGFGILSAVKVPNDYGSEEYRGPWWLFGTEYGKVRLGWRKRVIDMDFSDVAPGLVVPADVSKGPGTAHAWSEESMIEFLRLARESARIR